jgi:hypothetical protein
MAGMSVRHGLLLPGQRRLGVPSYLLEFPHGMSHYPMIITTCSRKFPKGALLSFQFS